MKPTEEELHHDGEEVSVSTESVALIPGLYSYKQEWSSCNCGIYVLWSVVVRRSNSHTVR